MSYHIQFFNRTSPDRHSAVEDDLFGLSWSVSSWSFTFGAVKTALSELYVSTVQTRNEYRADWEESRSEKERAWLLEEFDNAAKRAKYIGTLKEYFNNALHADADCLWQFEEPNKLRECLSYANYWATNGDTTWTETDKKDILGRFAAIIHYMTMYDGEYLAIM
jgi:hypothetical protein